MLIGVGVSCRISYSALTLYQISYLGWGTQGAYFAAVIMWFLYGEISPFPFVLMIIFYNLLWRSRGLPYNYFSNQIGIK